MSWSKDCSPPDLSHLAAPARDLYSGQHHRSVVDTVDRLRISYPRANIALAIVSAGYGLLDEGEVIVPYDVAFAKMGRLAARRRANGLHIREDLQASLRRRDIAIFLLSRAYLDAIGGPSRTAELEVYFSAQSWKLSNRVIFVPAGRREAKALSVTPRMVRAKLFAEFVDLILVRGWRQALGVLMQGNLTSRVQGQT